MMMNLKKDFFVLAIAGTMLLSFNACKSKVSDADLKAKIEVVTAANPAVSVDVKEGVVTLSGTVSSVEEKDRLVEAIQAVDKKHVKSVVSDVTVESTGIVINNVDADLQKQVVDAVKDFPTVQAVVKEGVITVTGTVEQARVQTLKMSLDALNPKKVDMLGLTIK